MLLNFFTFSTIPSNDGGGPIHLLIICGAVGCGYICGRGEGRKEHKKWSFWRVRMADKKWSFWRLWPIMGGGTRGSSLPPTKKVGTLVLVSTPGGDQNRLSLGTTVFLK